MPSEHIVSSFDNDLQELNHLIATMGGLAELQLENSVLSLIRRDGELAEEVRDKDKEIDAMEAQVHMQAVKLLGLRQPMADDLRMVIGAFQTASDIERIGDYARNIAKRTTVLNQMPPIGSANHAISRMSNLVRGMIHDVLDAYQTRDDSMAHDIRLRDVEVDQLHTGLFRELLTYMMEDPRNITACTHLLFIAKNIERIGDHATNIAEHIHMIVHGSDPDSDRPKYDKSSITLIDSDNVRTTDG